MCLGRHIQPTGGEDGWATEVAVEMAAAQAPGCRTTEHRCLSCADSASPALARIRSWSRPSRSLSETPCRRHGGGAGPRCPCLGPGSKGRVSKSTLSCGLPGSGQAQRAQLNDPPWQLCPPSAYPGLQELGGHGHSRGLAADGKALLTTETRGTGHAQERRGEPGVPRGKPGRQSGGGTGLLSCL